MAGVQLSSPATRPNQISGATPQPPPTSESRRPALHKLYELPAPIRTFPLPSFYPNNPVSLFQLAYAWLSQALFPPPNEPSVIHEGVWSPESHSVHIYNEKSVRALWEQGFFGKGDLSRSEPNWLKREQARRGLIKSSVSEEITNQRRLERRKAKWERARLEQEAIQTTRLQEAQQALLEAQRPEEHIPLSLAPIGPLELLALPNSDPDLALRPPAVLSSNPVPAAGVLSSAWNGESDSTPKHGGHMNGLAFSSDLKEKPTTNGHVPNGIVKTPTGSSTASSDTAGEGGVVLKRRKSVRFSPKVQSATFQHSDPPSPNHAIVNGHVTESPLADALGVSKEEALDLPNAVPANDVVNHSSPMAEENKSPSQADIVNIEHLQLTPEEAFFLNFGLGTLKVIHPSTGAALSTEELFQLFRQYSHMPIRRLSELIPDDNFLVHYAVYHHFRSLGWVPRPGIKFGVDWLLYVRGPVFDHAEFGVIIIPSYSHNWWEGREQPWPRRSWHNFHGVARVMAHVLKTVVLVYVEIPPLPAFEEALQKGPAEVFRLYETQEVIVKRWSSNRSRG